MLRCMIFLYILIQAEKTSCDLIKMLNLKGKYDIMLVIIFLYQKSGCVFGHKKSSADIKAGQKTKIRENF